MSRTLDEIYGCDLGEYLQYHNKSKEDLILEIEKDIELLEKSLKRYSHHKERYTVEALIDESVPISNLIEKKQQHLKRIQNWF